MKFYENVLRKQSGKQKNKQFSPMSPCEVPSLNDDIIYIKNGIGELLLHKSQLNGQNMALTPDIFFKPKKTLFTPTLFSLP